MCRVTPVLGSSSSSSSSSAPLSSSSSFDHQSKPPPGWKELLKSSSPYTDNHHYYSAEYPCRYPSNPPGSPAALQTIITTTTKVRLVGEEGWSLSFPLHQLPAGSLHQVCHLLHLRTTGTMTSTLQHKNCFKRSIGPPSIRTCPGVPHL